MRLHRIPNYGEDPSEELVEWLSNLEQDWDGDDCGLNITLPDGTQSVGGPGDWVCFDPQTGVTYIEKDEPNG